MSQPRPRVCYQASFQANRYNHVLKRPSLVSLLSINRCSLYRINHVSKHQVTAIASVTPYNVSVVSEHWHPIQDYRVYHRITDPDPKDLYVKQSRTLEVLVKARIPKRKSWDERQSWDLIELTYRAYQKNKLYRRFQSQMVEAPWRTRCTIQWSIARREFDQTIL